MNQATKNFNHLLIVDDDQSLGRTLLVILKKAGYEGNHVTTGKEALDLVRTSDHHWGAVLIDIRLPDINGIELLRELKRINFDISAIMITGYADVDTAVESLNEGAYAYIRKPYNVEEVKAIIARLIEKQRLIRENEALVKKLYELNAALEEKVRLRTKDLESANSKLTNTLAKLREAHEAQSQFIAVVSHELRNPMTVISGFTEMLLDEKKKLKPEKMDYFLRGVHEESLRSVRLVGSILDFSQIQEKGISLICKKLNFQALVNSVVDGLKIVNLDIAFEVSFGEGGWNVISDRDRLKQVLINLLGNAIKYSPKKGVVRVEVSQKGGEVLTSVLDSGPGIPDDQREKIFERFYRTADDINIKTPGTGLGLTISKEIVEALGGRIWVEGREQGSKFSFTFPANRAD